MDNDQYYSNMRCRDGINIDDNDKYDNEWIDLRFETAEIYSNNEGSDHTCDYVKTMMIFRARDDDV